MSQNDMTNAEKGAGFRGRPPGSRGRFSRSSVEKLASLGFDPIEHMVLLYQETCEEIEDLSKLKLCPQVMPNGEVRRYSAMAHSQLLTIKQKLVNDLMRYGYGRAPEMGKTEEVPVVPKLSITLTAPSGKVRS